MKRIELAYGNAEVGIDFVLAALSRIVSYCVCDVCHVPTSNVVLCHYDSLCGRHIRVMEALFMATASKTHTLFLLPCSS